MTLFIICLAGFFGALVDAIVGGGGLITIPALLATGMPTYLALGTNKFASSLGTISSTIEFFRSGEVNTRLMKYLLPFSLIGSAVGVWVVLRVDPEFLRILIIILVLAIGLYTLLHKELGLKSTFENLTKRTILLGMFMALGIGFYNGFFGPGTGSFLIFALIAIYGFDFKKASANAKMLNLTGNATALILFLINGEVMYAYGIPMAFSMMLGGQVGAKLALKKGSKFIKPVFVVVSLILVVKMVFDLLSTMNFEYSLLHL
ncbi:MULTISPECIES: TSUP family transporter [unclassified Fusibacter]|uniref:TSUP family transporter n=1 Tax=unclassified Fusibacter TaxID=2624464 RepID=UPI001FADC368|nr:MULTISPECIES: TSUP family transporter [unclassified Fusibacter]